MKDDTISRQAVIEILATMQGLCTSKAALVQNSKIWQQVKDLPSAGPMRKKGKWIKMSDADGIYWACNECGEDIPRIAHFDPQFDLFPRIKSIDKTNFCPNCGADMRGDADETCRC